MANKFLDLNGFKHFINKIIGKTSIAGIGDGTCTGAISAVNAITDALMKHTFSGVQTNAVLTDALSIDTGDPYGENNRCAYVSSWDGTANMPYACSFGVREVSKCNTITVVRITGYTLTTNDACIWINFYVNDHWLGWQSTLGWTLDWPDSTDGSSFGYNFLYIDTTNHQSPINRPSYWAKGFDNSHKDWVNIPPTMPITATGYREVYWSNPQFITVKITETYPDIGKQYYCRYGENGLHKK